MGMILILCVCRNKPEYKPEILTILKDANLKRELEREKKKTDAKERRHFEKSHSASQWTCIYIYIYIYMDISP